MRILHIIQRYYPYVGGSELYFQELSERLAREGHRVEVWTTDAWDLDYFWTKRARRIKSARDTHNGVAIRRFRVRHLPLPAIYYRGWRRVMAEMRGSVRHYPSPLQDGAPRALDTFTGPRLKALTPGAFDLVHSTNIPFELMIAACRRLRGARGYPPHNHPIHPPGRAGREQHQPLLHDAPPARPGARATRLIVQTSSSATSLRGWAFPRRRWSA